MRRLKLTPVSGHDTAYLNEYVNQLHHGHVYRRASASFVTHGAYVESLTFA